MQPSLVGGAIIGMHKMRLAVPLLISLFSATVAAAGSQTELSFYGGAVLPDPSRVSGTDPGGIGTFSFGATWEPTTNIGLRLTWWDDDDFGWGVDFNSVGAQADANTLSGAGLTDLGLEDGLSLVTVNAYRRWSEATGTITPYVGAGVGMAVPQVSFDGGGSATNTRQFTGPAFQVVAGAQFPLTDALSVFGEYQGSYSVNFADLTNGGDLNTEILSSGVNFGISLGF